MTIISKGVIYKNDIFFLDECDSFPCIEIWCGIRYYCHADHYLFYYSDDPESIDVNLGYVKVTIYENNELINLFKEIKKSYDSGYDQELFDMYIEQLESIASAYDGFHKFVEAETLNVINSHFNKNCKK